MSVWRRIYRTVRPWDGTSWSTVVPFNASSKGCVAHRFHYRDNTLCGLTGVNSAAHTVAPSRGDERCVPCLQAKAPFPC